MEETETQAGLTMAQRFASQAPGCQLRISGSIALQLALLAAGCYDVLVAGGWERVPTISLPAGC